MSRPGFLFQVLKDLRCVRRLLLVWIGLVSLLVGFSSLSVLDSLIGWIGGAGVSIWGITMLALELSILAVYIGIASILVRSVPLPEEENGQRGPSVRIATLVSAKVGILLLLIAFVFLALAVTEKLSDFWKLPCSLLTIGFLWLGILDFDPRDSPVSLWKLIFNAIVCIGFLEVVNIGEPMVPVLAVAGGLGTLILQYRNEANWKISGFYVLTLFLVVLFGSVSSLRVSGISVAEKEIFDEIEISARPIGAESDETDPYFEMKMLVEIEAPEGTLASMDSVDAKLVYSGTSLDISPNWIGSQPQEEAFPEAWGLSLFGAGLRREGMLSESNGGQRLSFQIPYKEISGVDWNQVQIEVVFHLNVYSVASPVRFELGETGTVRRSGESLGISESKRPSGDPTQAQVEVFRFPAEDPTVPFVFLVNPVEKEWMMPHSFENRLNSFPFALDQRTAISWVASDHPRGPDFEWIQTPSAEWFDPAEIWLPTLKHLGTVKKTVLVQPKWVSPSGESMAFFGAGTWIQRSDRKDWFTRAFFVDPNKTTVRDVQLPFRMDPELPCAWVNENKVFCFGESGEIIVVVRDAAKYVSWFSAREPTAMEIEQATALREF